MNYLHGDFGDYYIQSVVGEGSTGVVYRALDLRANRTVALKVISSRLAQQPNFVERLHAEAAALRPLTHPGILRVYAANSFVEPRSGQKFVYLAMEFIGGGSLQNYLDNLRHSNRQLSLREALTLLSQIAAALAYAHEQGVVHHDIKPANILLRDPDRQPVLTDFGLARLGRKVDETATQTGLGSLAYMSPEQVEGKTTDQRSDIYALGVVFYQLVTGRLPYVIEAIIDARKHLFGEFTLPSNLNPALPTAVDTVVQKAMARERDDRYPSATALAAAVSQLLTTVTSAARQGQLAGGAVPAAPEPIGTNTVLEPADFVALVIIPQRLDVTKTWHDEPFRLLIAHQFEQARMEPLNKPYVRIGRHPDNDIVLNDPHVSNFHLVLQQTGQTWQIIDQDSLNGTYIEGQKQPSQEAKPWSADETLRLGSYFLRWQALQQIGSNGRQQNGNGRKSNRARPMAAFTAPTPLYTPDTTAATTTNAAAGKVLLNLLEKIEIDPGQTAELRVGLQNQGAIIEHYRLELKGNIAPNWVVTPPKAAIPLGPQRSDTAVITIAVPGGATATAGEHTCRVAVYSALEASDRPLAEKDVLVVIRPFEGFVVNMHPSRLRHGDTTQVTITNQGNGKQTYTITPRDAGDELRFTPPGRVLPIDGGQARTERVEIQVKKRPWVGTIKNIPFTVEIDAGVSNVQSLPGSLEANPRIPLWVFPVLLILLLIGYGLISYYSQVIAKNEEEIAVAGSNLATVQAEATAAVTKGAEAEATANAKLTIAVQAAYADTTPDAPPIGTPIPVNKPTAITLSQDRIEENNEPGVVIGTFTTDDLDSNDTHTYSLASGSGDSDNGSFRIEGNNLLAAESFDFEEKEIYSIRVQSTDSKNDSFQQQFPIYIDDVADFPIISMTKTEISIEEGKGTLEVMLTVDKLSLQPIVVNYSIIPETAEPSQDYFANAGSLTWLPNSGEEKTISILLIDDDIDELDEIFTVTLSNPLNANLAQSENSQSIVTIVDDDSAPSLSFESGVEVSEDISGGKASVNVIMAGESSQTVSVRCRTIDNAASNNATAGSDYTAVTNQELKWSPGETGPKSCDIPIIDDVIDEPAESFSIELVDATNASTNSKVNVTIKDDDDPPKLEISNLSVTESNDRQGFSAEVEVKIMGGSYQEVTVECSTKNEGTATVNADYTRITSQGLMWEAEDTSSKKCTIPILYDEIAEDDETFTVELNNPSTNATIGEGTASVTIVDDDLDPILTIQGITFAENEAPTSDARVPISLSGDHEHTVTVLCRTVPDSGTATAGSDYEPILDRLLTWPPGDTSTQNCVVKIPSDNIDEPDETFSVQIHDEVNATITSATATVTLTDDDLPPTLSIGDSTITVAEDVPSGNVSVPIEINGGSYQQVTVECSTVELTSGSIANEGQDFSAVMNQLITWLPEDTSPKACIVPIIDDPYDDEWEDERFKVMLHDPSDNVQEISTAEATITIQDDDPKPLLAIHALSIQEDNGSGNVTAEVMVTISGGSEKGVSVDCSTRNDTATAGEDFVSVSNYTLAWAAKDTTHKLCNVTIKFDDIDEPDELFTVGLSNAVEATIDQNADEAVVTILDNDPSPILSIENVSSVIEDDMGSVNTAMVAVSINDQQHSENVTVECKVFSKSGDTATENVDYDIPDPVQTLMWADGDTTEKYCEVRIVPDTMNEIAETFTVELINSENGEISAAEGESTVTITDNDLPALSISDLSIDEENTNGEGNIAMVEVTINGEDFLPITTACQVFSNPGDTATPVLDYEIPIPMQVLTWASGDTKPKTCDVPIIPDTIHEMTETFTVMLVNVSNAQVSDDEATVEIIDNDPLQRDWDKPD